MLQDVPDYEEEVMQAMLDERRPLLLPGRAMVTDPEKTSICTHGLLHGSCYVQSMANDIVMGYNAIVPKARKVFARMSI